MRLATEEALYYGLNAVLTIFEPHFLCSLVTHIFFFYTLFQFSKI